MTDKRQRVIKRLKKQARQHYNASLANTGMDCGFTLGDVIRGTNTNGHYDTFLSCMVRLRRIDPDCPKS